MAKRNPMTYKDVMKAIEELSKITPKEKEKDLTIEISGMTFHMAIDDYPRFMDKMNEISAKFEESAPLASGLQ